MGGIYPRQVLVPQIKPAQKLIPRIKLSQFLSSPENEFAKLIKEIESDLLFQKLMYPANSKEKVFAYGRFPKTGLSSSFYELKEEILRERNYPEIESLINKKKEVIKICQKIGVDNFSKYFLYQEGTFSFEEIANKCGLKLEEVKKIIDLLNEIAIYTVFYEPSNITLEEEIHYTKICKIERTGEDFSVNYHSPHLVRGRYIIDYEKIEKLKKENFFVKKELVRLNWLVKNMELVNLRKTILYQVCEKIISRQKKFLGTGEEDDLQPYTQSELAREIVTNPSVISRAVRYRSVEIPTGEEVPLPKFFLKLRRKKMELVKEVISQEINSLRKKPLSDEKIRRIIKQKYNLSISRRAVAAYRKELKINSSFLRNKNK